MNSPHLTMKQLTERHKDAFHMLYPIVKEEVMKRREQMIWLIAFAGAVLLSLLVALPPFIHFTTHTPPVYWLIILGVAFFSSICAYCILQHATRHRLAKQQLIALEQALGFYEDGWPPNGHPLFPKNWQSDWTLDHSVKIYLMFLISLTALVYCTILIQM